jgi:hypothetical protein
MWGQSLKIMIVGGDEVIKPGNYILVKSSRCLPTQRQGVRAGQDTGSSLETQGSRATVTETVYYVH